jgi:hypothetical protein
VVFIFAMVVGEYRCLGLSMEGTNIKMSHILSDSLSAKLLVVEQLLQKSNEGKCKLESSKIIPLDVIGNIRNLNQVRNGFSHQAAKSEDQAARIFSDHFEEVFDILQKLQGLKDVTLMRFFNAESDALKPRFEIFTGHAMSRTIHEIPLTCEQHTDCIRYLNIDSILLKINYRIYDLKPFIYFLRDDIGHNIKLCFYKKKMGEETDQQFIYEIIRESREQTISSLHFRQELETIRKLLPDLSVRRGGA